MRLSMLRAAILASALGGLLARPGFAQSQGEITNVTTNGTDAPPGPIVQNLAIDNLQNFHDAVTFDAYLFTATPLDFTLTVSGAGTYYIGYGRIENDTNFNGPGFLFSSIQADVLNASDAFIGLASYDGHVFSNGIDVISPTSITFNGPTGIPVTDSTSLYVGVVVTGSAQQTFDLKLTPLSVPEPSTLVLGLIGVASGLGYAARRLWRRRS